MELNFPTRTFHFWADARSHKISQCFINGKIVKYDIFLYNFVQHFLDVEFCSRSFSWNPQFLEMCLTSIKCQGHEILPRVKQLLYPFATFIIFLNSALPVCWITVPTHMLLILYGFLCLLSRRLAFNPLILSKNVEIPLHNFWQIFGADFGAALTPPVPPALISLSVATAFGHSHTEALHGRKVDL